MPKIQILYWSDFICPYCYIAEQRMKNLMKELNIMDKFEFKLLSFELDPNAPRERKLNIVENFAKKYYMPIEQAKATVDHINKLGKDEGIDFRYDTCRGGNTFKAHRLAKYIESKGNYENTEKIINLLYFLYFLYFLFFIIFNKSMCFKYITSTTSIIFKINSFRFT